MGQQQVIGQTAIEVLATTRINDDIVVATTNTTSDELLVGVHATLRTFITGMDGTDPKVPVATYVSQIAAKIGHDMVVEQTQRKLLEQQAIAAGAHQSLAEGTL